MQATQTLCNARPSLCLLTAKHHSHVQLQRTQRPQIANLAKQRPLQARALRRTRTALPAALSQTVRAGWAIREIREEDVEVLVSLQAKAFYDPWNNELIDSFFLNLFEADVRGIIKAKLKDQDKSRFQAFVAESSSRSDGDLAGVVEVSLQSSQEVIQALGAASGETYAYIACMAVAEKSRRQGIALQLLKAAEKQAQRWDQHIAALHVYKTNDIAVQAYEKAGYVPLREDGRWRTLLGARKRVLMCKNLKP